MKLSAQELSDMVSHRQFQEVVDLWGRDEVDDDNHALYQVFLAATMIRDRELVDELRQLLPPAMVYDASRDVLLMCIRAPDVYSVSVEDVDRLFDEAPDQNRKAVAQMTRARWHRIRGDNRLAMAFAKHEIEDAFRLILMCEPPHQEWRRNIALWYLIIGVRGKRLDALLLVLSDPAWSRKLLGLFFCCIPGASRFIKIY